MVITGAGGFAKEILEVLVEKNSLEGLNFYDDVNPGAPDKLFDRFRVFHSLDEVKDHFSVDQDNTFVLGVGAPLGRFSLYQKFLSIGGKLVSVISPYAKLGHYENVYGDGCCILTQALTMSCVSLGKGCLVNVNCTIGHDCRLGDFVTLAPNVNISGNCVIGDFSNLGTNCVLLPNITVGKNVMVGAGCVVTKDVPDNSLIMGVPGKIVKKLNPIVFK